MDSASEERFIQAAERDPAAFAPLYEYYFPKVYTYVRYRIPANSDVEDIVAEIFLTVIKKLKQFEWRHGNSLAAWLFRIARNRVADFYRGNPRQPMPIDSLGSHRDSAPLPEDELLRQERLVRLQQLLNTLSSRQQEIITLKFFGQLRNQQIAQILGIDERTVASHLCRGIRELHRKYYLELEE